MTGPLEGSQGAGLFSPQRRACVCCLREAGWVGEGAFCLPSEIAEHWPSNEGPSKTFKEMPVPSLPLLSRWAGSSLLHGFL